MLRSIVFFLEVVLPQKHSGDLIDVIDDIIGMVKINAKVLYKDNNENLENYWPVGSYLMLNIKSTNCLRKYQ